MLLKQTKTKLIRCEADRCSLSNTWSDYFQNETEAKRTLGVTDQGHLSRSSALITSAQYIYVSFTSITKTCFFVSSKRSTIQPVRILTMMLQLGEWWCAHWLQPPTGLSTSAHGPRRAASARPTRISISPIQPTRGQFVKPHPHLNHLWIRSTHPHPPR